MGRGAVGGRAAAMLRDDGWAGAPRDSWIVLSASCRRLQGRLSGSCPLPPLSHLGACQRQGDADAWPRLRAASEEKPARSMVDPSHLAIALHHLLLLCARHGANSNSTASLIQRDARSRGRGQAARQGDPLAAKLRTRDLHGAFTCLKTNVKRENASAKSRPGLECAWAWD